MLDKLAALGHLTLIVRDGVATLSVRGDSFNLDVSDVTVEAVTEAAQRALSGDVANKIKKLEEQIERLKAAL